MKVSPEVLAVLDAAEIEGLGLRLVGQLDRKLYTEVNKVLEAAGGKWTRHAKAHLFPEDPTEIIERIAMTGEVSSVREFGFFPTPDDIVTMLIERADITPGVEVLEPSAGQGAIASRIVAAGGVVDVIELMPENAAVITAAGYARDVLVGDFLDVIPEPIYDRVVMNPPFAKQDDVRHVLRALAWLRPGGLLVSVMGGSVPHRQNRMASDFRAIVEEAGGSIEALPAKAFRVSGTDVSTVVVVIPKPESAEAAA